MSFYRFEARRASAFASKDEVTEGHFHFSTKGLWSEVCGTTGTDLIYSWLVFTNYYYYYCNMASVHELIVNELL